MHLALHFHYTRATKRRALVRIGMGAISAATALPALLEDIASGELAVRVQVAANSELMAALRAGDIDFFIGGVPRNSDFFAPANRFELLRLDTGGSVRLFTRPQHPLRGAASTRDDLARYPVASGSSLRDTMDPLVMDELGIGPLAVEAEDYDLLAAVVRASDYLLVASSLLATMRPDLGLTPLGDPLPTQHRVGPSCRDVATSRRSPIGSATASMPGSSRPLPPHPRRGRRIRSRAGDAAGENPGESSVSSGAPRRS